MANLPSRRERRDLVPARWDTLRELEDVRERMDRLFDDVLGGAPLGRAVWAPAVDLEEADDKDAGGTGRRPTPAEAAELLTGGSGGLLTGVKCEQVGIGGQPHAIEGTGSRNPSLSRRPRGSLCCTR